MENGLTEQKISELDLDTNHYSDRERLAIEYAEKMAVDHHEIDEVFFARMKNQFDDAEVLELGMMICQYIGFGRLLKVLDLTPEGVE